MPISSTAASFFFATVAIAFLGLAFSIIEGILVFRFTPWAFGIGPCVLRTRCTLPRPHLALLDQPARTSGDGCFKVLGLEEVLFRRKGRLFGYRLRTAVPMKGRIRWEGGDAVIEGRLSIGGLLFYGAWLVGVTVWCVIAWRDPETGVWAPWALLGGWLVAAVIMAWSVWYETRLARRIIHEVRHALLKAAA